MQRRSQSGPGVLPIFHRDAGRPYKFRNSAGEDHGMSLGMKLTKLGIV